jgi:UDP-N-acetylmuramoyl-L-alanyl-D-glutamate--2,6-diaminopimelate ligase
MLQIFDFDMMKLNDLIKGVDIIDLIGNNDMLVNSIIYDSRKAENNALFVAIKGGKIDGHYFIPEVINKGVCIVVCEEIPQNCINSNITFIKVQDSRKALAIISDNWFDNPSKDLNVIGITGTNGKTTITYILKEIFENAGKKVGVIGTTGIFIDGKKIPATHTTPESLELMKHFQLMLKNSVDVVLMEVSSHSLHQSRVSAIDFNTAVFTNLTHDHLDYHKTFENYAKAKKILFEMLPKSAIAISNLDDSYGKFMLEDIIANTKTTIGRNEDNQFIIQNEQLGLSSSHYDIIIKEAGKYHVETRLMGRFNIDNTAQAFLVAYLNGISPNIILEAIRNSQGAPGRMQRVKLKNNAIGIVDYAHTPDALEKALNACKELKMLNAPSSKIFCIFGCGGDRDKSKRPKMGAIAVEYSDFAVITDDNPRSENSEQIIQDIVGGIDNKHLEIVKIISDRAEAIKYAVAQSKENDIILVAGKGHETYQIYGKEIHHFDDIEELQRYG